MVLAAVKARVVLPDLPLHLFLDVVMLLILTRPLLRCRLHVMRVVIELLEFGVGHVRLSLDPGSRRCPVV